jgi:hypothetical protein
MLKRKTGELALRAKFGVGYFLMNRGTYGEGEKTD